jgi:hypothetical protein
LEPITTEDPYHLFSTIASLHWLLNLKKYKLKGFKLGIFLEAKESKDGLQKRLSNKMCLYFSQIFGSINISE